MSAHLCTGHQYRVDVRSEWPGVLIGKIRPPVRPPPHQYIKQYKAKPPSIHQTIHSKTGHYTNTAFEQNQVQYTLNQDQAVISRAPCVQCRWALHHPATAKCVEQVTKRYRVSESETLVWWLSNSFDLYFHCSSISGTSNIVLRQFDILSTKI